ncbi:MAG TPA: hypothetical protein VN815_04475 [Steroidobacteraceae bacterium]|jgi:hypothetical protein|nr:hypothetical protein [Steroidobacteraceae bacterium]
MNTMPANAVILVVLLVAAALAAIIWVSVERQRSLRLKRRYGPEYDLAVARLGNRRKAEAELMRRERHVAGLTIVPLSPADAARYAQVWAMLQSRFVDNPKGAVAEADQLVREVMQKRGYPMGDFEARAADISVDHPGVVSNYRAARIIAARDMKGEADTEELRQAVVHYRTLFDELLGVAPNPVTAVAPAPRLAVHS